jgi:hypothetical protein
MGKNLPIFGLPGSQDKISRLGSYFTPYSEWTVEILSINIYKSLGILQINFDYRLDLNSLKKTDLSIEVGSTNTLYELLVNIYCFTRIKDFTKAYITVPRTVLPHIT